jgi:hypothetical protein
MADACENCRFGNVIWRKGDTYEYVPETFYPTGDIEPRQSTRHATHIICRRHPPVSTPEGFYQPGMGDDDWCGEYEALP